MCVCIYVCLCMCECVCLWSCIHTIQYLPPSVPTASSLLGSPSSLILKRNSSPHPMDYERLSGLFSSFLSPVVPRIFRMLFHFFWLPPCDSLFCWILSPSFASCIQHMASPSTCATCCPGFFHAPKYYEYKILHATHFHWRFGERHGEWSTSQWKEVKSE